MTENNMIFNLNDFIKNPNKYLGKTVEIISIDSYAEVDFNTGLRAKILGYTPHYEKNEEDNNFELHLDFKPFEEFNTPLMTPYFYDNKNNPTLKWIETPYYKEGKDSIYGLMSENDRDSETTFKIIDSELYEEYFNSKESSDLSYVEYLENQVKTLRNKK